MHRVNLYGVVGVVGISMFAICGCSADIERGDVQDGAVGTEDAPLSVDANIDPDLRKTPMGLVHNSCVYEVPDGAVVTKDGSVTVDGKLWLKPAACQHAASAKLRSFATRANQPPTINGWVEDVASWAPVNAHGWDWLNEVDGTWKVPPVNPSQNGGLVYLFNGAQDDSSQVIIQPVLQWGDNGYFGGNSWKFASWYGGSLFGGNYFYSTPINVSPSDTLTGFVYGYACSDAGACRWHIASVDTTKGTSTHIYVDISVAMKLALSAVLEAYSISSCNRLPGVGPVFTSFTNVAVYQPWFSAGDQHQTTFNGDCNDGVSAPCWSEWVTTATPNCSYSAWSTATKGVLIY